MSDTPSDGLAGMPPGPELAARLAVIDPHDVPDEQLPELVNAQWRQAAYQQAQSWRVMAEIGSRDPMPQLPGRARWSAAQIFDNGVEEIRAELVLTRRAAGDELAHACAVVAMPRVLQALAAGVIDRVRAIRFAEGCAQLSGEQVEVLLDEVLPGAGEVSATGLEQRIARVAIALDPDWAQHRYQHALREQKVIGYLNRDGTAVVAGQNLPADDAAAACARVDALADAAKRAGAKAKTDMLRATIFLGLLDGRFHHMPETTIITELVRQFPQHREPAEASQVPEASEPGEAAAPVDSEPGADPQPAGVHLRVGLGTLLGLDDQPGEIAGWGNACARTARGIARRQRRSQWRYAILDGQGRLLFDGTTRHRPHTGTSAGPSRRTSGVRAGIVELHLPLELLTDPGLADRHPDWAGLLADLAGQYAEQRPIEQDPTARFAGRPLRRRQQTRYPRCLFRGCRHPASDCDLDHRHEHAHGGATDQTNTGPTCRHDHRLKTSGHCRLVRRDQHTFIWISPLGRKHPVTIDPIAAPLPKPHPRLPPPERNDDFRDGPEQSAPSFQPLDQHARPLPTTETPATARAVETNPDPPPF